MRRGDVVTVAASGDYGKPRPAVIVQSGAFPPAHPSVIVCQMTSELVDVEFTRLKIDPSAENGLRVPSQIMVDKPATVHRNRIGSRIGRLSARDLSRLDVALTWVMGLGG
jgi:mRNA interferase MazF